MALTVSFTPSKNVTNDGGAVVYTSRWVAAHNAIVFKLRSTLFPTITGVAPTSYNTVGESDEGRAILNMGTAVDPEDFAIGKSLAVRGNLYNGTFKIVRWLAPNRSVEIDTAFIGTEPGVLFPTFPNYIAQLKVFAGLPSGHKWQVLKPEEEIDIYEVIPDSCNFATFDIQEAIKQKVSTKNDLTQNSLPNDLNVWTGFRVQYQESYDTQVGIQGSTVDIVAEGSSLGRQKFTTDVSLDVSVGEYVQLENFIDDDYDGGVFRVASKSGTTVIVDLPFDSGLTLGGSETMQKYDISVIRFESGFINEGNQYYAVNSKLSPRSRFGSNLAEYVNTDILTANRLFLSNFEDKATFEGYYDDLSLIVDKSLIDSLGANDILAFSVVQFNRNREFLITPTPRVLIPNQQEGVYRIPFIEGIPPFIFELPEAPTISHLFFVRPADFAYPPKPADSGITKTIELDGTVISGVGDNFRYNSSGIPTSTRDREIFGGICLVGGGVNASAFWDFSSLGLTGVMTATVGWYKTSSLAVTLNKQLTGSDPEIDNTTKRFSLQPNYKYHDLQIFEDGVLFGRYRLEQRFDEVWLDASGNGNHLTGSSVTTAGDLWTEDNVNFNYANGDNNGFGHSIVRIGGRTFDGTALTIGEIVPAITATQSVLSSGLLEYRGRAAIDGKIIDNPTLHLDNANSSFLIENGDSNLQPEINAPSHFTIFHRFIIDGTLLNQGISNRSRSIFYRLFANASFFQYEHANLDGSAGSTITAGSISRGSLVGLTSSFFAVWDANGGANNVGQLSFYINNVLDLQLDYTAPPNVDRNRQNLGGFGLNSPPLTMPQKVWDLRLYNTFKNSSERQEIINGLDKPLGSELEAWFPIQENSGNTHYSVVGGFTANQVGTFTTPYGTSQDNFAYNQAKGATNQGGVLVPAALDINGDLTGVDALGNTIASNSGYIFQDFGNLLQVNPSNAPILRFDFAVDDTEQLTFAQVIEEIDDTGIDRYLKNGTEKRDYILVNTNTATPQNIADIVSFISRIASDAVATAITINDLTRSISISFGTFDLDLEIYTQSSFSKLVIYERGCFENAYYLTWLNSFGGWEYWLFRGEKDYAIAIENDIIASKNLFNNWDSDSLNEETEFFFSSIEAYEEREIRSQELTKHQADAIAKVKHSIQVQKIETDKTKKTILVDKGDITIRRDKDFFAQINFTIRETNPIPIQEQ